MSKYAHFNAPELTDVLAWVELHEPNRLVGLYKENLDWLAVIEQMPMFKDEPVAKNKGGRPKGSKNRVQA